MFKTFFTMEKNILFYLIGNKKILLYVCTNVLRLHWFNNDARLISHDARDHKAGDCHRVGILTVTVTAAPEDTGRARNRSWHSLAVGPKPGLEPEPEGGGRLGEHSLRGYQDASRVSRSRGNGQPEGGHHDG